MNSKLYMAKIIVLLLISITTSKAQFLDEFKKDKIDGWFTMVGDGNPEMKFIHMKIMRQYLLMEQKINTMFTGH
ncbi:MAG: hypothetical protein H6613_01450 [Ignavibacteriales bacterium]|nr:hypothetical protein [Ignavibacteriales bacterium]